MSVGSILVLAFALFHVSIGGLIEMSRVAGMAFKR